MIKELVFLVISGLSYMVVNMIATRGLHGH